MLKIKNIIIMLLLLMSNHTLSKELNESEKIDWLINQVKMSDISFLRNGDVHTSKEAAKHLRFKLTSAKKMFWFFGPEKNFKVQEFIDKIASKSSSTGNEYKVRLKDGTVITTKKWMDNKMKLLNKK